MPVVRYLNHRPPSPLRGLIKRNATDNRIASINFRGCRANLAEQMFVTPVSVRSVFDAGVGFPHTIKLQRCGQTAIRGRIAFGGVAGDDALGIGNANVAIKIVA